MRKWKWQLEGTFENIQKIRWKISRFIRRGLNTIKFNLKDIINLYGIETKC